MTSRREWALWTAAAVAVWCAVLAGGRIHPKPRPVTYAPLYLPGDAGQTALQRFDGRAWVDVEGTAPLPSDLPPLRWIRQGDTGRVLTTWAGGLVWCPVDGDADRDKLRACEPVGAR